jgi:hypothetical protein
MKENICTAAGVIGGFFAALLGGVGFSIGNTSHFHGD